MQKKMLSLFLAAAFVVLSSIAAAAAEKMVQLNVPGCSSWNSSSRIGSILKKNDGIKKYENRAHDLLVITFDDEETSLDQIISELRKGRFMIVGEPVYLK